VRSRQPSDPRARPARGTGELLVTGATGQLGRAVARRLRQDKVRFRALVRPDADRRGLDGTGAWLIEGDLTRPATLVEPMRGVRTVLHVAGVVRSRDPVLERRVHVDGTAWLLAEASRAGVRRVVAISSDTVLRTRRGSYARSKADAEELLRRWADGAADRELVILRPPMMLGPGSPHLASLRRLGRVPLLPLPPDAAVRRPVGVSDVADAAIAAIDLAAEQLPAEPFDLSGAEALSMAALIGRLARAEGRRPPTSLPIPLTVALRAARLLGRATLAGRIEGLAEVVEVDDRPARELLGWTPQSLDDLLRPCVDRSPAR
jgi:nucleoside-diphosphate-sugar epimerase